VNIFRGADAPFRPADTTSFVGPAQTTLLAHSEGEVPVHLYHVKFDAGARTNWHTHSGPQWLFITEGRVRVQVEGQPHHDLEAGDAVLFVPGERHWHGAVPGCYGAHLAINQKVVTTWLEPVTDAQYVGSNQLGT
jgi:quercetin dioxygenase-like cupin family protein